MKNVELLRPSAREFQKMKEMARKVSRKLWEMGKALLPNVKGKYSVPDLVLEYCYLGEDYSFRGKDDRRGNSGNRTKPAA